MVTSDRRRPGRRNRNATGSAVQTARSFYMRAVSEAERASLARALQVEGLDGEIALLRLRLYEAVKDKPADLELMFEGAALLSRLVATKFKLSQADAGDLKQAIEYAVATLSEMGREADDACEA